MKQTIRTYQSKFERAVEWRIEKIIKKRKNARRGKNEKSAFANQFRTKWGDAWYNQELKGNQVFYESFSGNNALCNPEAIFQHLLASTDHQNLKHVWALQEGAAKDEFDDRYAKFNNVSSVAYNSVEYFQSLAVSKYLFNNATFPPSFTKRADQIYTNTWHGTPLKKMGYDMPNGAIESNNILRNFAAADYLISPNRFTTETMYKRAYRLGGVYEGQILEEGYPRIDLQFSTKLSRESTLKKLQKFLPDFDVDKKFVLYAPTWKGESFSSPTDEADLLLRRVLRLKSAHGKDFQFFMKVHQRVYDRAQQNESIRPYLIPNQIPANEILSVADVLITDYSSIFFDFLVTGRPVIFFTPDSKDYESNRGLYMPASQLPGPVIHKFTTLLDMFQNLYSQGIDDIIVQYQKKYADAAAKYCHADDGHATPRIIDIIFGANDTQPTPRAIEHTNRTKLLIFIGGMKKNGITSSALNLLHNIDYNRFDVSVLIPSPTKSSDLDLYARIDPRVRQFMRFGSFPATVAHLIDSEEFLNGENNAHRKITALSQQVFAAEWRRIFGETKFDHIVDFSGYSGFWSNILIQGQAKSSTVWMHNNLIADAERTIDHSTPNRNGLFSQFNTYKHYDKLVSVSAALEQINAVELSTYAPRSKFTSASNTLNATFINDQAFAGLSTEPDGDSSVRLVAEQNLNGALTLLIEQFGIDAVKGLTDKEARIMNVLPCNRNYITFITAGRLSPEKNHERLIQAFAIVRMQYDNVRLVIMGEGPLKDELSALIHELDVSDSVTLAGHVSNPYEVLARAQCFVLSSDYEGQPMVILEALSLRLPVLTVDFGSARSSMGPDHGWIVPQSVEGLADGMCRFVAGSLGSTVEFDTEEFNSIAMDSFYQAIGVAPA